MANIKVEFKDEKKIVEYPDGKKVEYPKARIENHRTHLIKQKQMIDKQLADIDKDLADVAASKTQPIGE